MLCSLCGNDRTTWTVIAELGDYNPQEHSGNYAGEARFFQKQTLSLEEEMMEIHQTEVKGQTLEEAETNFLRKACALDSYGIDPYPVKVQLFVRNRVHDIQ